MKAIAGMITGGIAGTLSGAYVGASLSGGDPYVSTAAGVIGYLTGSYLGLKAGLGKGTLEDKLEVQNL